MDVREKLVELFYDNNVRCDQKIEGLADDVIDIIDHGVTVQECGYWVSLTDCANAGVYCSVCNKKVYKEDYAWCNRKSKLHSDYCPHCGAKMMPHPPKGE